ncbi:MAG: DUF2520 domain-containing protein [bacterium]|nr:DUF2520 domain-containing protein [bacterium]
MGSIQHIGIIGSGNTANFFADRLLTHDFNIVQIISRNVVTGKQLAQKVNAEFSDEFIIDERVEILLLCVSDNQIEACVGKLQDSTAAIICHCAGSVSIEILNKFKHYGVVYPLQTLSKTMDVKNLKVPFLLESNQRETLQLLESLIQKLGYHSTEVDSNLRMKYHLAAVFANNFTNAMLMAVEKMSTDNKLNFDLFRPLIERTIEKITHNMPSEAQTGPAKRNDVLTLEKHEEMLNNEPELLAIYQAITLFIKSKV